MVDQQEKLLGAIACRIVGVFQGIPIGSVGSGGVSLSNQPISFVILIGCNASTIGNSSDLIGGSVGVTEVRVILKVFENQSILSIILVGRDFAIEVSHRLDVAH
jgi:hypothetical protein